MNNQRRKKLEKLKETMEAVLELLQNVRYDEEEAMENLPENLQTSERYAAMEQAVEALEAAEDSLQEAIENVEVAME